MRIDLIIPTYNESENIAQLIRQFLSIHSYVHIIIADSDSPDGTVNIIRKHFPNNEKIHILECERKQGRGAAIAEAYKWIKKNSPASLIATADADFSHSPNDFPTLLNEVQNADVVIGSRYLKQSKIIGWPLSRKIFSASANLLARILLHIGIRDYTNGYRLFNRSALDSLNINKLDADGFIMLSQELTQWHTNKLKIVEVPTTFVNRVRGTSNFRPKLIIESLLVIFKTAWHARKQKNQ